jgi:hypothetical protein
MISSSCSCSRCRAQGAGRNQVLRALIRCTVVVQPSGVQPSGGSTKHWSHAALDAQPTRQPTWQHLACTWTTRPPSPAHTHFACTLLRHAGSTAQPERAWRACYVTPGPLPSPHPLGSHAAPRPAHPPGQDALGPPAKPCTVQPPAQPAHTWHAQCATPGPPARPPRTKTHTAHAQPNRPTITHFGTHAAHHPSHPPAQPACTWRARYATHSPPAQPSHT